MRLFPNITKLTIPVTPEILAEQVRTGDQTLSYDENRGEHHSILRLQKLRYLSFEYTFPNGPDPDPIRVLQADLSVMWGLVNSNSDNLKCLRVFLMDGPPEFHTTKLSLSTIVSSMIFVFVPPRYFPHSLRLNPLNLKIFQIGWFPCASVLSAMGVFRPEILEVLSLLYCRDAYRLLFNISTLLTSLKYLQVVELENDISLLEGALITLPPLKGLYLSMLKKKQLFYRSLQRHQESMERLVLVTKASSARLPKIDSRSRLQPLGAPPRIIDFTAWTELEELTLHYSADDVPSLCLPRSLKFLSIVDPKTDGRSETYYDQLLTTYTWQQISGRRRAKWSLKAVIINSALRAPYDTGQSFKIFEPVLSSESNLQHGSKAMVRANKLEEVAFYRRFPGTSILRSNRKPCSWIDILT
ncbi:hypothetical protein TWF281_000301 [Arthrobotrys megalospora]